MAEGAVNSAVQTLTSLLLQEIFLLESAKQGVEDMKLELESIGSFLKDADTRAAQEEEGGGGEVCNQGVKTWVKQLREEAYRIEDAIDKYRMKEAKLPHSQGVIGFLHKGCCFIKILKLRCWIATEVKDIKSSLLDIQRRAQSYNFRSIDQGSSSRTRDVIPHDSRVGSFFMEDPEVVGIESIRDQLIDFLVNGKSNRSVIAVVGEGGLGKTTLAGEIYNNDVVKRHFDCQAWITVGKKYMKKELLQKIIHELNRPIGSGPRQTELNRPIGSGPRQTENMEEKDLITTLRELLKDRCYMVVLDGVWKVQFWEDVEHALLDNNKSSRLMLTTRNRRVADIVPFSIVHVHMLEPLPSDKAWDLFCRKAFGYDGYCPPNLKELVENIIERCGGLPLAVVAIGVLLSTKNKDVSEWRKLLDDLGSKLGSDPHLKSCNRVLSEGYYDLPYHLKSCLLYFGMYPESYKLSCSKLIHLRIAEGFVQNSKHPPSEQLAEEHLTELINRNLVQVSERKVSGRPRRCRVHDLMYEIILKKTKDFGFCQVSNEEDLDHCSTNQRISIHRSADSVLASIKDSKIRSICLFDVEELPKSFVTTLVADFKLLKVLDLEDAPVDYLPNGVGKLFHLHYLSLKNTGVKKLPKSIGMLVNLETLDLKWSFVTELPTEIRNLKKLRCLLVWRSPDKGPHESRAKIHEGFGALTDLQKLRFVEAESEVLEELTKLKRLRDLGIRLANEDVKDMFAIIKNLENLEYLGVEAISEKEILDVQSVASPPQCLQSFFLSGNIMKLPNWISELQNLTSVDLVLWRSTDDLMRILQALPNLLKFILTVTYCDELLHLKEGWFPKLKVLYLYDFEQLKLLMIDKGAMPNLREMEIGPCPLVKEIPAGIEHLRNLKSLVFIYMVKEFYCMMKTEN